MNSSLDLSTFAHFYKDPSLYILNHLDAADLKQLSLTDSRLNQAVRRFLGLYRIGELNKAANQLITITDRSAYEELIEKIRKVMPKGKEEQTEGLFLAVQTFPELFRLVNHYESHARKTRSVALTRLTNSSGWKKFKRLSPSPSAVGALCEILMSMPQRDLVSYEVYPNYLMKPIAKKILSAPVGTRSLIQLTSLCYQKLGHQVFAEALEDHFSVNFSKDLSSPFNNSAKTFASLFQESLVHLPSSDRERYLHMVVERTLERSHSIITLKLKAKDFLGSKKWAKYLSPAMQAHLSLVHPLFAGAISRYLVSYSNAFINIKSLVISGNKHIASSQLMPILSHLSADCHVRHIEIEETKAGFTEKDIPQIAEFFSSHPSIQLSAPFEGEAKQKLFLKGISKQQLREE